MRKKKGESLDVLSQLGYETSDVSAPSLTVALFGMFIFVGVASALMFGFYTYFLPREAPAKEAGDEPVLERLATKLQAEPLLDIKEFRELEDKKLHSYAWKDKATGTVQIPVDEAITLMAQRASLTSEPTPSNTGVIKPKPVEGMSAPGAMPPPAENPAPAIPAPVTPDAPVSSEPSAAEPSTSAEPHPAPATEPNKAH